jgi:hypothetical protein
VALAQVGVVRLDAGGARMCHGISTWHQTATAAEPPVSDTVLTCQHMWSHVGSPVLQLPCHGNQCHLPCLEPRPSAMLNACMRAAAPFCPAVASS